MKRLLILFLLLPLFTRAQIITTVAGSSTGGYSGDGGPATSANVGHMAGIAFDHRGNYYFSEGNNTIRRVSYTGIITTITGTGTAGYNGDGIPATAAELNRPAYIALDTIGNLYIPDENNNRVRKVDISGNITTIAGTGSAGYNGDGMPATASKLNQPYSICIDPFGNIFIEDLLNYRIRKIDISGNIATYAGNGVNGYSGDNGPATNAQITTNGIICTDMIGNLYLCDGARIRKVNVTTNIITTYAGNGTFGYSGDGGPATSAELWSLDGITSDPNNNIYIADGNRIRKVDTLGTIRTVAGDTISGYIGDNGPATSAELSSTRGVALDLCGNLYVSDNGNTRIRKVIFNSTCTDTTTLRTGCANVYISISIYPNPTNDIIHIDGINTPASYRLLSIVGAVFRTGPLQPGNNTIPISSIPSGMYILEISSDEGERTTRKIIKQ